VPRPTPIPDADSAPFWGGCREHQLLAQRCDACGRWRWPPAAVCPHCRKLGGTWTKLRGTGTLSSFAAVRQATHPAFSDAVPYTIAFVSLDEAPADLLLLSNLVGCSWEDVRVGMRVEVTFDDGTADAAVPIFRPAADRHDDPR
jgi:uncharacterized OB-fold protein